MADLKKQCFPKLPILEKNLWKYNGLVLGLVELIDTIVFFAFFQLKQVKGYGLVRMGQNFDQAKCDNTFWPRPNILKGSVHTLKKGEFGRNMR